MGRALRKLPPTTSVPGGRSYRVTPDGSALVRNIALHPCTLASNVMTNTLRP